MITPDQYQNYPIADVADQKGIKHEHMLMMLVIGGVIKHTTDCIVSDEWLGTYVFPISIEETKAPGILYEYEMSHAGYEELYLRLKKYIDEKYDR